MLPSKPSTAKQWFGVDVSKSRLDVYAQAHQKDYQFDNNTAGIAALSAVVQQSPQPAVVCEASGGYEQMMARALDAAGIAVSVVNPKRVRDLAKGMGQLAKTDRLDARMIASYGELTHPAQSAFASERADKLKRLVVRRREVVEMMTVEKNRYQRRIKKRPRHSTRVERIRPSSFTAVLQADVEIYDCVTSA